MVAHTGPTHQTRRRGGGAGRARGGRGRAVPDTMKVLRRDVGKDGVGTIKMVPEHEEDVWDLYNVVFAGDVVSGKARRKVQRESGSGKVESEQVSTTLEVRCSKVEYDAGIAGAGEGSSVGGTLRVSGRVCREKRVVKMGAHHTLEFGVGRSVSVTKGSTGDGGRGQEEAGDGWGRMELERIRRASDPRAGADVAVLVMQEGVATLCLVGGTLTHVCAKVECSIPKKHGAAAAEGQRKAMAKFFGQVARALGSHVRVVAGEGGASAPEGQGSAGAVKCLVIASPGFVKEAFWEYVQAEAAKGGCDAGVKAVAAARERVVLAHCHGGHKGSVAEVLRQPELQSRVSDTKAVAEVRAMDAFLRAVGGDQGKAFYGMEHVAAAAERGAVSELLLSDALLRSRNVPERRRCASLCKTVEDAGGKVHIFSSMHPTGEQLRNLAGVAAMLRFPCPDIEAELDALLDSDASSHTSSEGDGANHLEQHLAY